MKQYRVYVVLANGKAQCRSRGYNREDCVLMAGMLSMMHLPDVVRVELREPDGTVLANDLPPPPTAEQEAEVRRRIAEWPPEVLEARKKRAAKSAFAAFSK